MFPSFRLVLVAAHRGRKVVSTARPARTEDYLTAVAQTRPTLTDAAVAEFEEDIELRTRL